MAIRIRILPLMVAIMIVSAPSLRAEAGPPVPRNIGATVRLIDANGASVSGQRVTVSFIGTTASATGITGANGTVTAGVFNSLAPGIGVYAFDPSTERYVNEEIFFTPDNSTFDPVTNSISVTVTVRFLVINRMPASPFPLAPGSSPLPSPNPYDQY